MKLSIEKIQKKKDKQFRIELQETNAVRMCHSQALIWQLSSSND